LKRAPVANTAALALLRPHSDEWFEALLVYNMRMGLHVLEIVATANGDKEVCSACGDKPAKDMKIADQTGFTLKLCEDCVRIRKDMFDEVYITLETQW
jgi:hypothetical protein